MRGTQVQPAYLIQDCAGLATESKALKLLNVNTETLWVTDPSIVSYNFIAANGPKKSHHFRCLHELLTTGSGFCYEHGTVCKPERPPENKQVSKVVGFMCSPYSTTRSKRLAEGTEAHPESGLYEAAILSAVEDDVDELWLENVFGLAVREKRGDDVSPLQRLIGLAHKNAEDYDVAVYFMDASLFLFMSRRRIWIHLLHQRRGGAACHARMNNYLQVVS